MYAEGHIDVTNDHKVDNIAILSHKRKTKKGDPRSPLHYRVNIKVKFRITKYVLPPVIPHS